MHLGLTLRGITALWSCGQAPVEALVVALVDNNRGAKDVAGTTVASAYCPRLAKCMLSFCCIVWPWK